MFVNGETVTQNMTRAMILAADEATRYVVEVRGMAHADYDTLRGASYAMRRWARGEDTLTQALAHLEFYKVTAKSPALAAMLEIWQIQIQICEPIGKDGMGAV